MSPDFGLTPELIELVKKEEGWRSRPYLCPAGYPTIGYGHRIPNLNHPPITLAQGIELLNADLRFHRDGALKLSPGLLAEPPQRLAAVVDFCFNLGEVAYAKSTMRKMIDAKKWPDAAAQMRRWVYYRNPTTKRMEKHHGLMERRGIAARWLEA